GRSLFDFGLWCPQLGKARPGVVTGDGVTGCAVTLPLAQRFYSRASDFPFSLGRTRSGGSLSTVWSSLPNRYHHCIYYETIAFAYSHSCTLLPFSILSA